MTEREKMIAGLPYSVLDEELIHLHRACVDACVLSDSILPSKLEERREKLRRILGRTGENFLIEPGFRCDYGFNIELGENFFANYGLVVLDCAPVTFGKNCFIGPQCGIYTAVHPLDAGSAPQRGMGKTRHRGRRRMVRRTRHRSAGRQLRRRSRHRRRQRGHAQHSRASGGGGQSLPRAAPH